MGSVNGHWGCCLTMCDIRDVNTITVSYWSKMCWVTRLGSKLVFGKWVGDRRPRHIDARRSRAIDARRIGRAAPHGRVPFGRAPQLR